MTTRMLAGALALAGLALLACAPAYSADDGGAQKVTAENFSRAESDLTFSRLVRDGGFGKYFHIRKPTPIDHQPVVRMNRDTLYSAAVFDLDAGPVIITLPDPGTRFMSLQVIDEDQYTHDVFYGAGSHTLTRDQIGTRYVVTPIRILVDPSDPKDLEQVHALQDAVRVSQKSAGRFEVPRWDPESQRTVREALIVLGRTIPDSKRTFGTRADVDPVRHLIGSATTWGGNPEKDAIYLNVTPEENDGRTVHRLTVRDVPVDGFWSISVYDAKGYFQKNARNTYTLNNITAKAGDDGATAVQFGDCKDETPNCLPITRGWNYIVRLYRPRASIIDGTWKFPEAEPIPK